MAKKIRIIVFYLPDWKFSPSLSRQIDSDWERSLTPDSFDY